MAEYELVRALPEMLIASLLTVEELESELEAIDDGESDLPCWPRRKGNKHERPACKTISPGVYPCARHKPNRWPGWKQALDAARTCWLTMGVMLRPFCHAGRQSSRR